MSDWLLGVLADFPRIWRTTVSIGISSIELNWTELAIKKSSVTKRRRSKSRKRRKRPNGVMMTKKQFHLSKMSQFISMKSHRKFQIKQSYQSLSSTTTHLSPMLGKVCC
jgi:hypothetical protein